MNKNMDGSILPKEMVRNQICNYKLYFMKSMQTGDIKEDGIKRIISSFKKNFLGMK